MLYLFSLGALKQNQEIKSYCLMMENIDTRLGVLLHTSNVRYLIKHCDKCTDLRPYNISWWKSDNVKLPFFDSIELRT